MAKMVALLREIVEQFVDVLLCVFFLAYYSVCGWVFNILMQKKENPSSV